MKTHLTVIGTVNIGFGIIGLFFGFLVILILSGFFPIDFGNFPAALVGTIAGSSIILFSIAFIIAGAGILKESAWARIMTLILSTISLIKVPWGTAWGIYSIWVLVNPETVSIFSKKAAKAPEPLEIKEPEIAAVTEEKKTDETKKEEKEEKKENDNKTRGPEKYAE